MELDEPPDNSGLLEELRVPSDKRKVISEFLERFYRKDSFLYEHCVGVGRLMRDAADYLNGKYCFDRNLSVCSGLVHDEGKLGVSLEVLSKADKGGFNPDGNDGLQMFQPHVEKGLRDLRPVLPKEAGVAALHHFPDYFPDGIFGFLGCFNEEEMRSIYRCSRLLHVVDYYEASIRRNNGRNRDKPRTPEETRVCLIEQRKNEAVKIAGMVVMDSRFRKIMIDELRENRDLIDRLYRERVFNQ